MYAASLSLLIGLSSCVDDWGQSDPPAGTDKYAKSAKVATFDFEDDIDPQQIQLAAYSKGEIPEIVDDEEMSSRVLHLNGGYAKFFNPFNSVELQEAGSLTFYVKKLAHGEEITDEEGNVSYAALPNDLNSALVAFQNANGTQNLYITPNGGLVYDGIDGELTVNDASSVTTGLLNEAGQWHYVALQIHSTGYTIYVDGNKRVDQTVSDFDCSKLVKFVNEAAYTYVGYGSETQANEMWIDNLTFYRNALPSSAISFAGIGAAGGSVLNWAEPIYEMDFENGLEDCTIKGGGQLIQSGDSRFGTVFSNAVGGMRANYLVLPSNLLSQSASTQALSIGVWVNRGNETDASNYQWSPLFSAYGSDTNGGDNSWPMMDCLYRGVLQVNCNGWSDYTDAQNVAGVNTAYHAATGKDWLEDGEWHYYACTITPTTAKVYIDGEIANEWVIDGVNNTAAGLFSDGNTLTHICLGGNQAWNYADPDPGFWFDDLKVYNQELSQEQIKANIRAKGSYYFNSFDFVEDLEDVEIIGAGSFANSGDENFGTIFSNAVGGMRANYLRLPSDLFSYSKESQALSVSVWVNRGNETSGSNYQWSPLFSAYTSNTNGGENSLPMFICQYRGVLQLNCNGWSDYTDDQNDNGANALYHDATGADWLADGGWHLYTATFTPTTAKVYFDGELKNSWTIDGVNNTAAGLFNDGNLLTHVCLGGNQAWSWGDPDPGFWFDDFAMYNYELSEADILRIYNYKK
jgi:hypothetical protein